MKKLISDNRRFLTFFVCFVLFRLTIADWNPIPSGSMKPTLLEGDVVFVNRVAYDLKVPFTDISLLTFGEPQRGDVVTFSSPVDDIKLIKRIMALPGDIVEMKNKRLFINGKALQYQPVGIELERSDDNYVASFIRARELGANVNHQMQWVNGAAGRDNFGPIAIPAGKYLMLGDNRDQSIDSRYIGLIERKRIVGHAIFVLVSGDMNNYLMPRFDRFGLGL